METKTISDSKRNPLVLPEELDALAKRGQEIYDTRLRSLLEPQYNNQYVAIHLDTGDYALGADFREAKRGMRKRYPADGRLVVMKIGTEPEYDGLAAR